MGSKSSEKKVVDVVNQEKKKQHEKDYNDSAVVDNMEKKKSKKKYNIEEERSEVNNVNVECREHKKKKKKKQKIREVDDGIVTESVSVGDGIGVGSSDENVNSKVGVSLKDKKRKKIGNDGSNGQTYESLTKDLVHDDGIEMVKRKSCSKKEQNGEGGNAKVNRGGEDESHKERKKRKRGKDGGDEVGTKKKSSVLDVGGREFQVKERKKKKKSDSSDQFEAASQETTDDGKDGGNKNLDGGNKVRKKNSSRARKGSKESNTETAQESGKVAADSTDQRQNSASKKKSKSVSFSKDVEIFPPEDVGGTTPSSSKRKRHRKTVEEGDVIWAKRFSKEEDEMLREAVENYIVNHNMEEDEDAIEKIMNCRKHPEVKGCWNEIGLALPWRPKQAVYYRAHIIYQRAETRAWTQEELDEVREFHKKYGADWKVLAKKLGKHRFHVKDAWRRIKMENLKKGFWSQDEYQTLFDLVNKDLRLRTLAERKIKHGMLRDNISWTAISEKLETRNDALCCMKWYRQLTSPMVARGEWLDTDDYRLLIALYELDACCMEDVEWESLLEHRPGDACRKRWNEMVKHLGAVGNKSFAEIVDVLLERYCPDVLEAREIYDSKTPVDE